MIAPLLVGFVMGFAFAGCAAVLLFTRKPRRDPIEWEERTYAAPAATTITINKRSFDL